MTLDPSGSPLSAMATGTSSSCRKRDSRDSRSAPFLDWRISTPVLRPRPSARPRRSYSGVAAAWTILIGIAPSLPLRLPLHDEGSQRPDDLAVEGAGVLAGKALHDLYDLWRKPYVDIYRLLLLAHVAILAPKWIKGHAELLCWHHANTPVRPSGQQAKVVT